MCADVPLNHIKIKIKSHTRVQTQPRWGPEGINSNYTSVLCHIPAVLFITSSNWLREQVKE